MIAIGRCRKRTTSAVQTPSPMRSPGSPSERLERAEPARDHEVDGHDDQRDRRERGRERQVVRDPSPSVDDVADEARAGAADERRRDVVAERQREREDRARDDAREARAAGSPTARSSQAAPAEVARGLDVGVRDPLERRVDRQDHERQPDVGEDDPHRRVRVAEVRRRAGRPSRATS